MMNQSTTIRLRKEKKSQKQIRKKNKIHSIANVPIKRMRTRNMSKNLSNHIYQNTTNKKRKKFTEKSTLINDENLFRGWKI